VRSLVSNFNLDPPSHSRDEPRRSPAVCTLRMHHPPAPVPLFLLKQNLSPKDIAGSEAESLMTLIGAMGPKEF